MKNEWHRSESRVVRPFEGIDQFLNDIKLRLLREGDFVSDGSITLPSTLEGIEPAIDFSIDIKSLKNQSEINLEELKLFVSIEDFRMKRNAMILSKKLEELPSSPWVIPKNHVEKISWGSTVKIRIALVLANDKPIEIGKPFLGGQWLAKKEFSIHKDKETPNFEIQPTKKEDFISRGLPGDTLFFVECIADDLNQIENPMDAVAVYLHEDAYETLAQAENAASAKLIMNMILSEILSSIISHGFKHLPDGEELIKGNLLCNLVEKLQQATDIKYENLKKISLEPGYPRLRAHVHSQLDVCKNLARCNFKGA